MTANEAAGIAGKYLQDRVIPESFADALSALVETASEGTPVIKGWVARDEDQSLWFHFAMPYKAHADEAHAANGIWHSHGRFLQMDTAGMRTVFKDLAWNDDPVEAGLFIKPLAWAREQTASATEGRNVAEE